MNANTVIAICATVIAVASLGVSVYAVWATRKHNRLSVQPLLGLATRFRVGDTAGLLLSNFGLGPAKITNTELTLDGDRIGDFSRPYVDKLRSRLSVRPHATTLGGHPFLDTDYEQFLLSVDSYDPSQHREFRELIEGHLKIEIQYESIYGGKRFTVVYPRDRLSHSRLGSAETISLGSAERSTADQVTARQALFPIVRKYPPGTGLAPSIGHAIGTARLASRLAVMGRSRPSAFKY